MHLLLYQSESNQKKNLSRYFKREVLYSKSVIQMVEEMRSQTGDKAATRMLATAGSHNQPWAGGTKGGSGVPRAQGGILGQKPELGPVHMPRRRCSSLEVSPETHRGRVKYAGFSFPPASRSPDSNYQWPKLIGKQPTWKASKRSPERLALLLHSTGTLPLPRLRPPLSLPCTITESS